jgi:glycosyltransferase 2 family protein
VGDRVAPAWRTALAIARRLFTPLALVGLAVAAYAARDEFATVFAQARPAPLIAAVVAWSALNLLVPAISHAWLAALHASPGYRALLGIHMARLPARYLPGGIWHTVSRFADLHAQGTPRAKLAALAVLENAAPPAVALALGVGCALLAGRFGPAVALAALAGTAVLAILPLLVVRAWQGAAEFRLAHGAAAAFAGLLVFWCVASLAFGMYWHALAGAPAGGWAGLAAAYLVGWAAGFAAIFAPQGIGVFEATAAWLLEGVRPYAALVVLAAGFRIVALAGDALAYGLAIAWRWRPAAMPPTQH